MDERAAGADKLRPEMKIVGGDARQSLPPLPGIQTTKVVPWLIRMKRLGDFYRAGHHTIVVLAERSARSYFFRVASLFFAAA